MIVPPLVVLLATFGYPIIEGVRISLSSWSGVGPLNFIGLDNYISAFQDPAVVQSVLRTLFYAVVVGLGVVTLASALAAAVSRGAKGSGFYRVIWFLPSVIPVAASGVFWSTAFQPGYGAVNKLLGFLGLGDDHAWLGSSETALFPVMAVAIWANIGFAFLLVLGAMEQVPVSTYEAASIDGAGPVRQFFSITLPLIRPILVVTIMLQMIWAANEFSLVYAMTGGGPGTSTSTLPVFIYNAAFKFTEYGVASAMAIISGVVLLIVGAIGLRLSRAKGDD